MENESLLPRIAIPDEGDRATVAAALVRYWNHLSATAIVSDDQLWVVVGEGQIVMDLLACIHEETMREVQALADKVMDQEIQALIEGEEGEE